MPRSSSNTITNLFSFSIPIKFAIFIKIRSKLFKSIIEIKILFIISCLQSTKLLNKNFFHLDIKPQNYMLIKFARNIKTNKQKLWRKTFIILEFMRTKNEKKNDL